MASEQVTITISAPDRSGVDIATDSRRTTSPAQVDLFASHSAVTTAQPSGAARTDEPAVPSAEPAKVAPAASARAAEATRPWEDLSAGVKGVTLPMSAALYAKMKWITENVPKMSLQKIAKQGAEAECDRLIERYYKP